MLEIIIALVGIPLAVLTTWFGVVGSAKKAEEQTRRQKGEENAATKEAYLRHLQEEFVYNRRLMREIQTYVNGQVVIDEILAPAETASTHLRFNAWDALVRAGVLAQLAPEDQRLFRAADSAGRRSAQDVQTIAANWRRTLAWYRSAPYGSAMPGVSLDESMRLAQRHTKESLESACVRTDEALARLKELLPEDKGTPAA